MGAGPEIGPTDPTGRRSGRHHSRGLIPRECLRDLARNPFCGRMGCDVDQDKVSADQPNDDDGIEQVEANVGTTNRSMAAMSGAWLRRKVRHPSDGGPHRLTMYFCMDRPCGASRM